MVAVLQWTSDDVCTWIGLMLGLERHVVEKFGAMRIDGKRLLTLDSQALKELGVNSLAERKTLMLGIESLKKGAAPVLPSPPSAPSPERPISPKRASGALATATSSRSPMAGAGAGDGAPGTPKTGDARPSFRDNDPAFDDKRPATATTTASPRDAPGRPAVPVGTKPPGSGRRRNSFEVQMEAIPRLNSGAYRLRIPSLVFWVTHARVYAARPPAVGQAVQQSEHSVHPHTLFMSGAEGPVQSTPQHVCKLDSTERFHQSHNVALRSSEFKSFCSPTICTWTPLLNSTERMPVRTCAHAY